jgi:hypothetical protein
VFLFLSVGLMLTDEFTLLDELTEVRDVATAAVFPTDGPKISDRKGEENLETRYER